MARAEDFRLTRKGFEASLDPNVFERYAEEEVAAIGDVGTAGINLGTDWVSLEELNTIPDDVAQRLVADDLIRKETRAIDDIVWEPYIPEELRSKLWDILDGRFDQEDLELSETGPSIIPEEYRISIGFLDEPRAGSVAPTEARSDIEYAILQDVSKVIVHWLRRGKKR